MGRKKKDSANKQRSRTKFESPFKFNFDNIAQDIKDKIWGTILIFFAFAVFLSFFNKAGMVGLKFLDFLRLVFGNVIFLIPLILIIIGYAFFNQELEKRWKIALASLLFFVGLTGITAVVAVSFNHQTGFAGKLGDFLVGKFFVEAFGLLVLGLFHITLCVISVWLMIPYLTYREFEFGDDQDDDKKKDEPVLVKKIFSPKFDVEKVPEEIKVNNGGKPFEKEKEKEKEKKKPLIELNELKDDNYVFPSLDLLDDEDSGADAGDIKINSAIIKRTLQNFGIPVEVTEVNIGPTVTQYAIKPAEGVNVAKITSLSKTLSLALSAHPIRIEAPIPGRPLVGIETPNKQRSTVRLKALISDHGFEEMETSLRLALGKNVSGEPIFADLAKMPHMLVAGATGSGKTICLNALIMSLLYANSPKTMRLILVDPKRVEFQVYNELPHLLCPVIYNAQKTLNALSWMIEEMDRRFDVISEEKGARDIQSYNARIIKRGKEPMPYIVFIIDELADLMSTKGKELEAGIVRISQMARAVGIHLILATQRPSVNVITGLIKANVPGRVAFRVASQIDSRTIIDSAGGEKLLGAGDMLFVSSRSPKPVRLQSAFIADKEIKKVVDFIVSNAQKNQEVEEKAEGASQAHDSLAESVNQRLEKNQPAGEMGIGGVSSGEESDDPMYDEAKKIVLESGKASSSFLQRRLRLGYARAARLIDLLEQNGVIGPGNGAKPREVYGFSGESSSAFDESQENIEKEDADSSNNIDELL
ncbi:DNA translocase FtsK [Candidatus Parcubacteria bacterium]|nr:DNA translocase FtsK [Candidatus Parcubacteria bacterium]